MGGVDDDKTDESVPRRGADVERKEFDEMPGVGEEAEPSAGPPVSEAAARAAVTDSASDASEPVSPAPPVPNITRRRDDEGEGEGEGAGAGDDGRDLPKTERRARDGRTARSVGARVAESKRRTDMWSSRGTPGDQVGWGDSEEGGVEPGEAEKGESSRDGETRRDDEVDSTRAGVEGTRSACDLGDGEEEDCVKNEEEDEEEEEEGAGWAEEEEAADDDRPPPSDCDPPRTAPLSEEPPMPEPDDRDVWA
jgi:hypothetical protein